MGENRYGCTNHRKDRGCDNRRSVMRSELEQRVNSAIPDALLTPDLIEDIRANVATQVAAAAGKPGQKAKDLRARLRKVQKEIDNLMLAFKSGARSATMIEEMAKADKVKADLAAQIEKIRTGDGAPMAKVQVPVINPSMLRIAGQALADAARNGSDHDSAREWREMARSMIQKIVVHPLNTRGVALEVHGRLAVMLAAVEAWNAEEARLQRSFLAEYAKLRDQGKFVTTEDRILFLQDMNAQIERRKRSFERFQLTVVAGA